MRFGPPVRFTRRPDGRHLAYQVVGEGDLDLVYLSGWSSHLGLAWNHPSVAEYFGKLSSFSRLLLFDGGVPLVVEKRADAGSRWPILCGGDDNLGNHLLDH